MELSKVAGPSVAGLVAFIVLMLAVRPWRCASVESPAAAAVPRTRSTRGRSAGAWAFGLGFLAAWWVVEGALPVPPASAWHWIACGVAAAMVLGQIAALIPHAWIARGVVTIGLAATALFIVRSPVGEARGWVWSGWLAAAVAALWLVLDVTAARRPGASLPVVLFATFSIAALVVVFSGWEGLGLITGSLAAASAAATVVAWWSGGWLNLSRGATAVVALALPTVLLAAMAYTFFERIADAAFVLPIVAPAAGMAVGEVPHVARLRPWLAVLVRLAVCAVPLGVSFWLVARVTDWAMYFG